MSEQEKKSCSAGRVGSVVMVEKTSSSRHKPYRPNELQDEADSHHKRSKTPIVPLSEEFNIAEDTTLNESTRIEDRKECAKAISSDKHKHNVAKILSSSTKKRESSPESITLATLESDKKKPIPLDVQTDVVMKEKGPEKTVSKTDVEDNVTDEITELRTTEVTKEHSEWSDDEEATGLPRSDSRSSRVSRAVRQFLCCGVAYEAPSEDNISTHRDYPI